VRLPPIALVAAVILSAAPVAAQRPSGSGRHLEVTVGLLSVSVLDRTASPVAYGGTGLSLQLGYSASGPRGRFGIRFGGASATLTSPLTQGDGRPDEQDKRGWIEGEYLRRLGGAADQMQWLVGGSLAVRATGREHHYGDPTSGSASYLFGSAALGPVVAAERPLGSGATLAIQVGIPFLAVVGRPYSDLRMLSATGLPLRVATLDRFQGADLAASYRQPVGNGSALVWGYHLVIERFADTESFRSATQAFTVAFSARLGGAR
jgi:hypothetical protein